MKFKRVGSTVDIPSLGLVGVEAGAEIEVSDDAAEGFVGQSGWKPVPTEPAISAADKKGDA